MPTFVTIEDTEVAPEAPVTSSLMTRLRDNAMGYFGAPSGTRMPAQQSSAVLGWTKDTSENDVAMRIVSGNTVGGVGNTFSSMFAAGRSTLDTVLLLANLPFYQPTVLNNALTYNNISVNQSLLTNDVTGDSVIRDLSSSPATVGGSLTLTPFGSNVGHGHQFNMNVRFVDFILMFKDA